MSKEKKDQKMKKNEQSLTDLRDTNIHMMGAPEEKTVQRGQREYLKKYWPKLVKGLKLSIQNERK